MAGPVLSVWGMEVSHSILDQHFQDLKMTWQKSLWLFCWDTNWTRKIFLLCSQCYKPNWPEKADSMGEGAVPDIGSPMILETDAQPQFVLKSILWSV